MKYETIREGLNELSGKGIHSLSLDESRIPWTAVQEINDFLKGHALSALPMDFDTRWIVQDGELRGKFTKRVSQFFKKEYEMEVSDRELAEIGNIAKQAYPPDNKFYIKYTDDLDWNSGDFADRDSCFWGRNEQARFMMIMRGAYAIQFWSPISVVRDVDEDTYNLSKEEVYIKIDGTMCAVTVPPKQYHWAMEICNQSYSRVCKDCLRASLGKIEEKDDRFFMGVGRAWILPDVPKPMKALVFNLYHADGSYRLIHAGLILAESLDLNGVKSVGFTNNSSTTDTLWINNGAVLVTTLEALNDFKTKTVRLSWNTDVCRCLSCSQVDYAKNFAVIDGTWMCLDCAADRMIPCQICETMVVDSTLGRAYAAARNDEGNWIIASEFKSVCQECLENNGMSCFACARFFLNEDITDNFVRHDGTLLCPSCIQYSRDTKTCAGCRTSRDVKLFQYSLIVDGADSDELSFYACTERRCGLGWFVKREFGKTVFPYSFESQDDGYELIHNAFRQSRYLNLCARRVINTLRHIKYINEVFKLGMTNDEITDFVVRDEAVYETQRAYQYTDDCGYRTTYRTTYTTSPVQVNGHFSSQNEFHSWLDEFTEEANED